MRTRNEKQYFAKKIEIMEKAFDCLPKTDYTQSVFVELPKPAVAHRQRFINILTIWTI